MAQWWGSCGAAWVVWFITLADVQSSGWWGSCRPVVVSPRGSTGGGSGGSSLAGSGHPGPGRTDLTPEKRQVVESSEASSPLFPCLYSSPVLYIFSITHTHTMPADLPRSFPSSLAVSPPISVLPPLSSSGSPLSPNRCHPPLFQTAPLLMALFDDIVKTKTSITMFTSLSSIKWKNDA